MTKSIQPTVNVFLYTPFSVVSLNHKSRFLKREAHSLFKKPTGDSESCFLIEMFTEVHDQVVAVGFSLDDQVRAQIAEKIDQVSP